MRTPMPLILLSSVAYLSVSPIQVSVAQQADQEAASAASGLEEIVVTARRREERVQTVPVAITAFSQQSLEEHHITQVQDLARSVPSLGTSRTGSDANGPSASQLNLRGLAGTVVYFAGVPLGNGDTNTQQVTHALGPGYYFDLDHVEIDKGPQGTLFGRNSIGGLISIEPKRPTNNFEGYAQVGLGNYTDRAFEGAINIPVIADKLLVRIAGQSDTRDGYTKVATGGPNLDDVNYQAWRAGITSRPTDDFENYFLFDGYWQRSHGSSTILEAFDPNHVITTVNTPGGALPVTLTGSGPVPGFALPRFSLFPTLPSVFAQQQALGVRDEIGRSPRGIGKDYYYAFTDIARWDLADDFTLQNIAGARVTKQTGTDSDTGTALPILTIGNPANPVGWLYNGVQYSDEVQLQGKSLADKLTWVLGGYLDINEPLGQLTATSAAAGALAFGHARNFTRSQAVFAHGIYDLSDYVDGLRFTAGYRYTWDYVSVGVINTKNVDFIQRNALGVPTNCSNFIVDRNCYSAANAHYSAPGWNVSLDEQLTKDTLIYVRSGNAYRPGGLNFNVTPAFIEFKPEHVTDVELGVKSDWSLLNVKARTNFDIFHTDYKSIQVASTVVIPDPNGGVPRVQSVVQNQGAATIQGAEFDSTFEVLEGLEISPQFSYVYARYGQYPANTGAVPNPPFLYFPKTKYAIETSYRLPLDASIGDVKVAVFYTFSGQQYDSVVATEKFPIIPSHDQLDLRVDWTNVFEQPIDASFYMTNATDNTYITGGYFLNPQLGFDAATYSAPRMFGFTVKYRFGHAGS